jgi:hypothetical protein
MATNGEQETPRRQLRRLEDMLIKAAEQADRKESSWRLG